MPTLQKTLTLRKAFTLIELMVVSGGVPLWGKPPARRSLAIPAYQDYVRRTPLAPLTG